MRPRSGPAVPVAAVAKGPGRAEPAPPSRSSARLPPCEVPARRAESPGRRVGSGEDAAGEAPHLAGVLGAGGGVPPSPPGKGGDFLGRNIYNMIFFSLAPFRQCLALLRAPASIRSVQAEPQHLGKNCTLLLGYFGGFLGFGVFFGYFDFWGFWVGGFFWRNFSRIRTKWLLGTVAEHQRAAWGGIGGGLPGLRRPQRAAPGGNPPLLPHLGCPRGRRGPWDRPSPASYPAEKPPGGCGRPDGTGRAGVVGAALAMVLHRPRTFRAHPRVAPRSWPPPAPSPADSGAGQGGGSFGEDPRSPSARPVTGPALNYLT